MPELLLCDTVIGEPSGQPALVFHSRFKATLQSLSSFL